MKNIAFRGLRHMQRLCSDVMCLITRKEPQSQVPEWELSNIKNQNTPKFTKALLSNLHCACFEVLRHHVTGPRYNAPVNVSFASSKSWTMKRWLCNSRRVQESKVDISSAQNIFFVVVFDFHTHATAWQSEEVCGGGKELLFSPQPWSQPHVRQTLYSFCPNLIFM